MIMYLSKKDLEIALDYLIYKEEAEAIDINKMSDVAAHVIYESNLGDPLQYGLQMFAYNNKVTNGVRH